MMVDEGAPPGGAAQASDPESRPARRPSLWRAPTRWPALLSLALTRSPCRLALFAVYALIVTWPLLGQAGWLNLFRDAALLGTYERDAAEAVRRFGSWPFWDPFLCGGMDVLGSPQTRFASPNFILSLLFGADRAEPLNAFFMLILGLEGTYRFLRQLGHSPTSSLLAAPVFAASGTFAAAPFLGWTNFFGFELLPWALWGWRNALRGHWAGAVVTAAAWAWMVGFGGTYAAPMTGLALFVVFVGELARATRTSARAAVLRHLALGATMTLSLALGLGAVRLWPLLETMRAAPRILSGHPGWSVADLLHALSHPVRAKGGNIARAEMYTLGGWFLWPVLFAGVTLGLARARSRRQTTALAALTGLALWTASGHAAGWSPFVFLRGLPLFSALRYPERYLVFVALMAAAFAALALTVCEQTLRLRRGRGKRGAWTWMAAVAGAVALLVANGSYLASLAHVVTARRMLSPAPAHVDRPFRQSRGNRWSLPDFPAQSRGSLQCWDAYPVPMSEALRADLAAEEVWRPARDSERQGEAAASLDTGGKVTRRAWAPDEMLLEVSAAAPGIVRVNQNFHPGWRARVDDRATDVISDDGLLGVRVPAGSHLVRLRYRSRAAFGGLATTLASVLVVGATFFFRRRREALSAEKTPGPWQVRPRDLRVAFAIPAAVLIVTFVGMREAPRPPPTPRAPSGEDLLVGAPAGAKPLGKEAAGRLVLEAAEVAFADTTLAPHAVRVAVYWRRRAALPRAPWRVRLIVQAQGAPLAVASHDLVSAWRPLDALPRDVTVRDVSYVSLPSSELPTTRAPADVYLELDDGRGEPVPFGEGEPRGDRDGAAPERARGEARRVWLGQLRPIEGPPALAPSLPESRPAAAPASR